MRVNGEPVVTYSHHKVVELFLSIPIHSDVELEIQRGYPLLDYQRDESPSYSDANIDTSSSYEQVMVSIVKGPLGFGFSLSKYGIIRYSVYIICGHLAVVKCFNYYFCVGETRQGPIVKRILDISRCAQLRLNDIIVEINGQKVTGCSHNDFVTLLKRFPKGNQARFLVLRSKLHCTPSY